jgi:hypothetical protein
LEIFTKLFGNLLAFVYHCFDRIVIHGYFSALSRLEQVVHFFRHVLAFRHADAEGRPLLHALEDIIDALGVVLCHSTCQGRTWSSLRAPFSAHAIGYDDYGRKLPPQLW